MDEPYGALDIYTRERMQEWLLRIWQEERKTIIFVTHSIEEALFLSDRIIVLKDGSVHHEFTIPFKRSRRKDLKYTERFNRLQRRISEAIG